MTCLNACQVPSIPKEPTDIFMSDPSIFLKVTRKEALTPDVFMFDLVHPEGLSLPSFTPGAHITVKTPKGSHRQYSLCSSPSTTDRWQIAIKREALGRGGSLSMADDLLEGDLLEVLQCSNLFELHDAAPSHVFVAGGIGITPILSMIRHLLSQGKSNFQLYYCTRDALSTAFLEELNSPALVDRVQLHHDHGDLQQALDFWPIFEQPSASHVYCCGPQGLMDSVRDMTGHWPSENIHFESFGAPQTSLEQNTPFDIVLQSTGKRIHVGADVSILEALRSHGESVSSSCESGTCGSCRTGFISGEVEHRDWVLLEDERSQCMMICVSRALSQELVLDR